MNIKQYHDHRLRLVEARDRLKEASLGVPMTDRMVLAAIHNVAAILLVVLDDLPKQPASPERAE